MTGYNPISHSKLQNQLTVLCVRDSKMAFRATSYWRSMMSRLGSNGRGFASSTAPRMKTFTPTAESVGTEPSKPRLALKGEFAPVYVVLGMVLVALSIGAHTAKQQLMHAPAVNVSKKKRESLPEVEDPDQVVDSADKFLNKSFLRKLAHVQEHEGNVPDPIRGEVYTRPRQAETLKSVGVAPARP